MLRPLRIVSIVGTRPNFIKIAPIAYQLALRPEAFEHVLIHTGQHYDEQMSRIFLDQLAIGEPDRYLGVGSGSHAQQTARVMERLEPLLLELAPDLLLVPGDVNSTMAAALVAVKLGIPVGHIEAGLRSSDRTMPEEINRVVTDAVSDLLFIHSPEALSHLLREGANENAIHYVGNTMIDTLVRLRGPIEAIRMADRFNLEPGRYLVVTLHRPALVDGGLLGEAITRLARISAELPVLFPLHPRTRKALAEIGNQPPDGKLRLIDPLGYLEFLSLVSDAAGVLTDSGGVQEETTFLGVPCLTMRENTERPVTIELGTNRLLGLAPERIEEIPALLAADLPRGQVPPLWDGHAAERMVEVLEAQRARSLVSPVA